MTLPTLQIHHTRGPGSTTLKETSEAFYTVDLSTKKFPGFRTIHAKNPFTTRTHVLSNLSLTQRADRFPTVIKEQLC